MTDDRYLFRPAANETVDYAANALNQYTLVNSAAITYDSKGNLTGDGVGTFTYDTENRMIGATVPGKVATYAYDPMGRRKSKTVNGVVTSYLHDGNREIAEYNGAGSLLRRYVYGVNLDEPLLQITSTGTKFYYRADALGSIVANEEHSSSFVQRFNYGAFGETTAATGHPYRYAARRIDEETGLYYYRARMYSPALGRFMQADPIGYEGGINLYAYVGNDPVNLVDPLGLSSQPSDGSSSSWSLAQGPDNIFDTDTTSLHNSVQFDLSNGGNTNTDSFANGYIQAQMALPPSAGALLARPPTFVRPPTPFKEPIPGLRASEAAKDAPSWVRGQRPQVGEKGKDFAKRLLDEKYGPGKYEKGAGSEFSKIQKYGDRGFRDPKAFNLDDGA